MEYRFKKHYSLEEAREALPLVRQWLKQLQDLMTRFRQGEKRLASLTRDGAELGGPHVNETVRIMVEMAELFACFHAREIFIDDLDRGLIDFPCLMKNKEVFLCWEQEDEDIQYWRELDSGSTGREPL